jgi:chromosome segregation ATPase
MTGGEIHQVSAELGGLKAAVQLMTSTWQLQETAATDGRRQIHKKLDDVRNEVTKLTSRVDQMGKDIAEIQPAIDTFKSARERQLGAQFMGKLIWLAFIGIAGVIGAAVGELLHLRH